MPRRKRTARGDKQQFDAAPFTDDQKRARKVTANRALAVFKSALNLAVDSKEHPELTKDAWAAIKPFAKVEKTRVRFLDDALGEQLRLVNACPPDFRDLVRGALLTGARYGELRQVRREDFSHNGRTLFINQHIAKSGKERYIHLTDEGVELLAQRCRGLESGALIFTKAGGNPWRRGNQHKPFKDACDAASIKDATFHCLRHTYASHLVKKGVPLLVVAKQLGHATTRMVERHYGHLAPSAVAEMVQKAMGNLGIVAPSNVVGVHEKQPA